MCYVLIADIYKCKVEVSIKCKAQESTELQLFYARENESYEPEKSYSCMLIASQFQKYLTFPVPERSYMENLRLDFGKKDNILTIEEMSVVLKVADKRDTVITLVGEEIEPNIADYKDTRLSAKSKRFIQVDVTNPDPYVVFNTNIYESLKPRFDQYKASPIAFWAAGILCGLMLAVSFVYILHFLKFPGIVQFIQQGSFLILGGAVMLFFVFLNNITGFIPDVENKEKRKLAVKPKLSKDNIFEFPTQFTDYTKDNFSFRSRLFRVYAYVKSQYFQSSPLPEDVLIGKDKWLFANVPSCNGDLRGTEQVPENELQIVGMNMLQKFKWLQDRGIKFYVMVTPNKNRVYPEKMPRGYDPVPHVGHNRLELYKRYFIEQVGIPIIDPTDSLVQAKQRRDVYYTSDTHWNLFGGFKGYQVIMDALQRDFPYLYKIPEEAFIFQQVESDQGDLAMLFGMEDVYKRVDYHMTFSNPDLKLELPHSSDIRIDYRDNKTIEGSKLKLLMYRDSYANYLIPFLNQHFKDATYIWSYEFTPSLIEELKPDVVIFETLQRFMPYAFLTLNPL